MKKGRFIFSTVVIVTVFLSVYFIVRSYLFESYSHQTEWPALYWIFDILMIITATGLITSVNISIIKFLQQRYPWKSHPTKRALLELFLTCLCASLIITGITLIAHYALSPDNNLTNHFFSNVIIANVVNVAAVAIYEAIQIYSDWKRISQPDKPLKLAEDHDLDTRNEKTYQKRFMVFAGEKIKSIPTKDIAYFFARGKTVNLFTNNACYGIEGTLKNLEDKLDPESFFRINRQFIVNIGSIENIYNHSRSRVKVELQPPSREEAIVSTERAGKFKEWLSR